MAPFRISDAGAVIGTTSDVIKMWMVRELVTIKRGYGAGKWATFTVCEIFRLSLTKHLADAGLQVGDAFKVAGDAMAPLKCDAKIDSDPALIFERMPHRCLLVWREDKWRQRWGTHADAEKIDSDWLLVVDMRSCLRRTVDRIAKILASRRNMERRRA